MIPFLVTIATDSYQTLPKFGEGMYTKITAGGSRPLFVAWEKQFAIGTQFILHVQVQRVLLLYQPRFMGHVSTFKFSVELSKHFARCWSRQFKAIIPNAVKNTLFYTGAEGFNFSEYMFFISL